MTKPTIVIIIIVYLASVLIVGIFGMQIMSFNNVNYIESITLTKDSLEFSINKETVGFEETLKENAQPYWEYRATFKYSKDMTVRVSPKITAKDPTLDPTDSTLNVSLSYEEGRENCITYENGVFKVNKRGMAKVTFRSQDNSDKILVLILMAL